MQSLNILLLAIAAMAAAHPHPHPHPHHTGECMEMMTSPRTGRSHWPNQPFKCLKGIKLPEDELLARKACHHKSHFYMLSFFKGDKIDGLKNNNLEEIKSSKETFYAKCMVDKLGLKAEDGLLNVTKITKSIAKVDSLDISALMKIQTIMTICAGNFTGTNATEQYRSYRSCISDMVEDYCVFHQQLLQKYLQRGEDDSVCANISTTHGDSIIEELFKSCMGEQAIQVALEAEEELEELPEFPDTRKGQFARTMVESTICVAERMKWFSEDLGFNATSLKDFVGNFTGWEDIQQVLEKVETAMDNCGSEVEGDAYALSHNWKICFAPKIVDICGFNNNVTKFFFPFLNADIQKAALEYIEEMMDAEDDMEYIDDYDYDDTEEEYDDDDETYDDYNESYEDEYDEDDDYSDTKEEDSSTDNVDAGLIMTANEGDEDAMLMDEHEERSQKERIESVEDDAENIMALMKTGSNDSKEDDNQTIENSTEDFENSTESAEDSENSTESSNDSSATTEKPDDSAESFEDSSQSKKDMPVKP